MSISFTIAQRLARIPAQILGINPFGGSCQPSRVPMLAPFSKRPTLPFPHPWNFQTPIRILDTFFWSAEREDGGGRHNRYLDAPGCSPILVTRDPAVIRSILTQTGDKPGQFDRDTMPSTGIARATGPDTLLFSNGAGWRVQRRLAASPFGKTTLFQPEKFQEFEATFRQTIRQRIRLMADHLQQSGQQSIELPMEPEIKAVMLELLVNNFFGASLTYDEIRNHYVPAMERLIDHIVRDTIMHRLGLSALAGGAKQRRADFAAFERLTDLVLEPRPRGAALWSQFKSDAPDESLRSNLKVFLAGALEATTSYASWAVSHLARHRESQERLFEEVQHVTEYTPENLEQASYLRQVLDETLRLTPSLYFLPRRATCQTTVTTADGRTLKMPAGTHVLLDVWHANRVEEFWGREPTGYPADEFEPDRWARLAELGVSSKEKLHFGFGHGPRVCPGKHLGELEVSLVVGAVVQQFRFAAVDEDVAAVAGVSTKPADGARVRLQLRNPVADAMPIG